MTPSKINNSTVTNTKIMKWLKFKIKNFLKIIMRMINEITEDTNKYLNKFQENTKS
jgi:hypothetical protein